VTWHGRLLPGGSRITASKRLYRCTHHLIPFYAPMATMSVESWNRACTVYIVRQGAERDMPGPRQCTVHSGPYRYPPIIQLEPRHECFFFFFIEMNRHLNHCRIVSVGLKYRAKSLSSSSGKRGRISACYSRVRCATTACTSRWLFERPPSYRVELCSSPSMTRSECL
jgi:hypothetical protein